MNALLSYLVLMIPQDLHVLLENILRRVYTQEFEGNRIVSSSLMLANTLLIFYSVSSESGRYVSYQVTGKEKCENC